MYSQFMMHGQKTLSYVSFVQQVQECDSQNNEYPKEG